MSGIQRNLNNYQANTNLGGAGAGPVPIGQTVPSPVPHAKQWSPTVANLLVILILELAAFAALRYMFKIVQR